MQAPCFVRGRDFFAEIKTPASRDPRTLKRCLMFELLCLGRANRASTLTSAAVDAGARVDNIFAVALGDSVYGAAVSASTARDAIVRNLICHSKLPP